MLYINTTYIDMSTLVNLLKYVILLVVFIVLPHIFQVVELFKFGILVLTKRQRMALILGVKLLTPHVVLQFTQMTQIH